MFFFYWEEQDYQRQELAQQWDDSSGRSLQRCPSFPFLGDDTGTSALSSLLQSKHPHLSCKILFLHLTSSCQRGTSYKVHSSPSGLLAMEDKGGGSWAGQEFGITENPTRVWFSKRSHNKIFQNKIPGCLWASKASRNVLFPMSAH